MLNIHVVNSWREFKPTYDLMLDVTLEVVYNLSQLFLVLHQFTYNADGCLYELLCFYHHHLFIISGGLFHVGLKKIYIFFT